MTHENGAEELPYVQLPPQWLVVRISSLSNILAGDVGNARSLSGFAMDSLVTVEMSNWIAREMDAAVSILGAHGQYANAHAGQVEACR